MSLEDKLKEMEAKMHKWIWSLEKDRSDGDKIWMLYGRTSSIMGANGNTIDVRMSGDELFYGTGRQVRHGAEEGWQRPYTGPGNEGYYFVKQQNIYDTEREAQLAAIKDIFNPDNKL